MISRARNTRSYMPTRYPDGAARSHGFGTPDRTCLEGIRKGLEDLTGKEHQIVNAYEISGLLGLTGSGHQIEHAYEVTGRGCSISRVRTPRFNMPSRYQDGAAGSHGFGTPNRTCLRGIRSGCRISRLRNTRSYMPTRYQDGAAGSHGFGTTVPTCIRGIRTGLQDMSGRGCRISQVGNWRSYMLTRY